jgi:hypothetical protein
MESDDDLGEKKEDVDEEDGSSVGGGWPEMSSCGEFGAVVDAKVRDRRRR